MSKDIKQSKLKKLGYATFFLGWIFLLVTIIIFLSVAGIDLDYILGDITRDGWPAFLPHLFIIFVSLLFAKKIDNLAGVKRGLLMGSYFGLVILLLYGLLSPLWILSSNSSAFRDGVFFWGWQITVLYGGAAVFVLGSVLGALISLLLPKIKSRE